MAKEPNSGILELLASLLATAGGRPAGIDIPTDYYEGLGYGQGLAGYQKPIPDYSLLGRGAPQPTGIGGTMLQPSNIHGTGGWANQISNLINQGDNFRGTVAPPGTGGYIPIGMPGSSKGEKTSWAPGWGNPYAGNAGGGLYTGTGGTIADRMRNIYQPYPAYFDPTQIYPSPNDTRADYLGMLRSRYQKGAPPAGG